MRYQYKATQNGKVVHEYSHQNKYLFIDNISEFHLVEASDRAQDFLYHLGEAKTYQMTKDEKVELSRMRCKDTIGDFTIEITISL